LAEKHDRWIIPSEKHDEVKQLILSYGAVKKDVSKNQHQVWRLAIGKSIFDLYKTGTLYNNQATSSEVLELREKLSAFSTSNFLDTGKEIKIGLDETGKGELFGHEFLCGVSFPKSLTEEIKETIGLADTKSRRTFDYWDKIFSGLDLLQGKGLHFITRTIPPWRIDLYNTNKIMDIVYKKIIADLIRNLPLEQTSLVIDNYQLDDNLRHFLQALEKKGALVKIEEKADDEFLEAKLASAIAKRDREKMMRGINERFKINGQQPGSGNLTDPDTQKWLKMWKEGGKEWPWFVKKSVSTIWKLDGKIGKVKKIDPPIRHELIAKNAKKLFEEGKLSVSSLRVSCPHCGSELNAVKLTPDATMRLEGRCVSCNKVITNLNTTLFYYNGYIVPDSSIILSGYLSKDLQKGKFFEDFTVFLHPRMLEECDNPGGKAELSKISDIANTGRINLITLQDTINYDTKADDEIINAARKNNAIIFTRDRGQYAKASGFDVFVLTT